MDILAIVNAAIARDSWPWAYECVDTGRVYFNPPEGVTFVAYRVAPGTVSAGPRVTDRKEG